MSLTALYSVAGLSASAGARAFLLLVALGALHYTPWFKLGESWLWLASPVVLAVLGTLAAVELAIDMHPDLAEFGDWAGYPTRIISGFLVAAAWTGSLDPALATLTQSGALGVVPAPTQVDALAGTLPAVGAEGGMSTMAAGGIGAIIAGVVHLIRSRARNEVRNIADATDQVVDKGASIAETAAVAGMTATAIWVPGLVPVVLVLFVGFAVLMGWQGRRWSQRSAARRLERRAARRAAQGAGAPEGGQ